MIRRSVRVSTVGRILPHQEVKIVDEQGRIVPRGETGELLTRGYCVMRGYWEDEQRTAESIDAAGWMHSGDLAVIDDRATADRRPSKDMIIRGGENIFPREIEEFLYRHPKIRTCRSSACRTRNTARKCAPASCCARAKRRPPTRSATFCRGEIAHFKVPRYVRFLETFPMTVTGKVQKFMLRQMMAAA
jgi:fatty-acyl-CoA synthase